VAGRILIADVQRAVARELGVPVSVMREDSRSPGARKREHSHPRQAAIALSSILTDHSYVRIGQLHGGRDHSTVISSCAAVARRLRVDPELHGMMRRVTLELVRG
jgi:chromosomal replication initiator protein